MRVGTCNGLFTHLHENSHTTCIHAKLVYARLNAMQAWEKTGLHLIIFSPSALVQSAKKTQMARVTFLEVTHVYKFNKPLFTYIHFGLPHKISL